MSKRNNKKQQTMKVANAPQPTNAAPEFGLEDMLSELEAIVAQAESSQAEEQTA
ncbi:MULTISPECIES: hypothetical protein [Enterobacteriaceae]|uniref:hypothetical protein n=1 Tax=Enterobacteriaceae TaxID=543 RepID=UPI0015DD0189|nr:MULTISPECIES: hypothetical protein [Enterobacteriaceae]BBQ82118.1 hypothetical protein WP3W18E02_06470 [Klebsiella sp. WP3-W18-ESBL-02]BBR19122.1 hypothetical protein WP3S18E05_06020 [Klebsiella sp. WP3-S18-ESBL-05]BBR57288.1 hypothetical protein WP4W18E05_06560 [Klebsiella sp. WP4-W18-ESBL-05]BBS90062.1 hypothetical protein WP7S18C02_06770 [Klebsiella sp. WP7-S18-CRE-02]BBS95084.1 hypothetical protein WP7S18C03_06770 [Klebsiella sp. WP7-S18-CRE-03]